MTGFGKYLEVIPDRESAETRTFAPNQARGPALRAAVGPGDQVVASADPLETERELLRRSPLVYQAPTRATTARPVAAMPRLVNLRGVKQGLCADLSWVLQIGSFSWRADGLPGIPLGR